MTGSYNSEGSQTQADGNVVELQHVTVHFSTDEGTLHAVDGVSFGIGRGKTLGLVGESGCGKSVTAQAIMRIVPPIGKTGGSIVFRPEPEKSVDLAELPPGGDAMRSIRGKEITMIFQEPMTSFSPVHTIGNQLVESILLHRTENREEARKIAVQMLDRVGIPNPAQRIDEYPHQLSGGMRQRAMIAMALSCNPKLLIADEPTTALDVTIQAQVLALMRELQDDFGMSVLFITHDLGVIAKMADEVAVMYLGQIVEHTDAKGVFFEPMHPYTEALLKSIPKVGKKARTRLESIKGAVPVPIDPKPGCRFADRCPKVMDRLCREHTPELVEVKPGHKVRCFLYDPVVQELQSRAPQSAGETR